MIEFCGEPTNKCKEYRLKVEAKIGFISALVPAILVCIPVIIAIFLWDWLFSLAIPVLVLFVMLASRRPSKKVYSLILPSKVYIQENTINSESEKFYEKRLISDVRKIVDMGEWYQTVFNFPHKSAHFICQKNLITTGTIEEFEELFKGKIERKILK